VYDLKSFKEKVYEDEFIAAWPPDYDVLYLCPLGCDGGEGDGPHLRHHLLGGIAVHHAQAHAWRAASKVESSNHGKASYKFEEAFEY
jgi:hypothetical protein